MNAPDPWQKKQEPFKGLILFAQVYAVLAFVLIVVIFAVTAGKVAKEKKRTVTDQVMPGNIQSDTAVEAEPEMNINPNNPMSSASATTAAYQQAQQQKSANAYQYLSIRKNTPDTTPDREEILSSLQLIHQQTKLLSEKIESTIQGFSDTLNTDNSAATTNIYFRERKVVLKNELFQYREKVIALLHQHFYSAGIDNLRTSLPLDDISPSEYAVAWRNSRLENDPDDALRFLGALDLELANFEASAMNQFPVTVTH